LDKTPEVANKFPEEEANQGLTSVIDELPENKEISICYVHKQEIFDRYTIEINDAFAYHVVLDIAFYPEEDPEPYSIEQCRHKKRLAKMERGNPDRVQLVRKPKSVWVSSSNT
jgi:hypothetical protein